MNVTIRPATRDDVREFAGSVSAPSVKAWVGEEDGKVIAIGGLAYSGGRWVAFLDLKPEARRHKYRIGRMAWRVMDEARKMGIRRIWAGISGDEPRAEEWMLRLGFERHGKFMRWKGD